MALKQVGMAAIIGRGHLRQVPVGGRASHHPPPPRPRCLLPARALQRRCCRRRFLHDRRGLLLRLPLLGRGAGLSEVRVEVVLRHRRLLRRPLLLVRALIVCLGLLVRLLVALRLRLLLMCLGTPLSPPILLLRSLLGRHGLAICLLHTLRPLLLGQLPERPRMPCSQLQPRALKGARSGLGEIRIERVPCFSLRMRRSSDLHLAWRVTRARGLHSRAGGLHSS